jgi:hypothetical protein
MRTGDLVLKLEVRRLRKLVREEVRAFVGHQAQRSLGHRHHFNGSVAFWSIAKRQLNQKSSKISAFTSPSGRVVKDRALMCELAANHYEELLQATKNIVRPHPYTDAPIPDFDNAEDEIPPVSLVELLETVANKKKKKSRDAHGISTFMLKFVHELHWKFLLNMFNCSFAEAVMPRAWKDTRIVLLAKRDPICHPSLTRPISMLDTFQKIGEKLFLSRFKTILNNRGILPHNQSGFREGWRLQTRVLLFLEDLMGQMANSAPVATIFVDFKNAFDMLWHEGCVGKLARMGVPKTYVNWIRAWLENRRAFIEIDGAKSRWFRVEKGGPQGGILTPSLFITYHADMPEFLHGCSSHLFADDLAAVIGGRIGEKFSTQCLDLEARMEKFFDQLEFYCLLSNQPINYSKTEALWSSRAIGGPPFVIEREGRKLTWTKEYKYLGYRITPKLGWSRMIAHTMMSVRQRVTRINSFRLFGHSSAAIRRCLFSAYVLPLFSWLLPLFPLFSVKQQKDLEHFYFVSLKRTLHCLGWSDELFSFMANELTLNDRCAMYWERFLQHLQSSPDGSLLIEKLNQNLHRDEWLQTRSRIACLRRSKRMVDHSPALVTVLGWLASHSRTCSIPEYEIDDIETLRLFPESFL